MLTVVVVFEEGFNEATQELVVLKSITLELEHSLVSLSKWESELEKPFLSKKDKTNEELLSYIEHMILTPNFPRGVSRKFSRENIDAVNEYINAKMTATTFGKSNDKHNTETITAELVYYWMIALQIPIECQYWHLNRLLTLIRVCNVKNTPPKKRSAKDVAAERRALNEQRRAEMKTRG